MSRATAQIDVEHRALDVARVQSILGVEPDKVVVAQSHEHKGRFKITVEGGTPVDAPFLMDELVGRLLDRVPSKPEPWQQLWEQGYSTQLWMLCEFESLITFSFELKAATVARLAPVRPRIVVALRRGDEENSDQDCLTNVGEVTLLLRNQDKDKSRTEELELPAENPSIELYERARAFLKSHEPVDGDRELRFSFSAGHMSRRFVMPSPLVDSLIERALPVGFWFYDWEE